ncbi:MAG: hypothetical protein AVDCRST_MAG53-1599, partial [uncultured Solirubrobacteraceae bacterium]
GPRQATFTTARGLRRQAGRCGRREPWDEGVGDRPNGRRHDPRNSIIPTRARRRLARWTLRAV